MKNDLNKITIINILSTIMLQGVAFFSIPVFTRLLGPEHFGYYAVFNAWVCVLTCIMGFGVLSTLGTGKYTFKDNYYKFRSSILFFGTILGVMFITVCLLLQSYINNFIKYTPYLLTLALVGALAHAIISFAQSAFIYEKRALENLFLSVGLSLSTVIISIYCIKYLDTVPLYMGRVHGSVWPYVVIAIIVWCMLFFKSPIGLHYEYCKFGLVVGFPVVFHQLAQNILSQANRVMMQGMGISSVEIGIYSLYFSLCAVLSTILNALNTSWCPFYYDDLDAKGWEKLEVKCKNYIEFFSLIVVSFLLLSREVSCFMADNSFWAGIDIIPILTLGVYFTFMYQFPVNFEFFHKQTRIIAIGTFITGGINITLNYLFIPSGGMYGASISTAVSYLSLFFLHYYIVTHKLEQKFHMNIKAFIPGLLIVCLGIVAFYILSGMWWLRWGIGFSIGIYELLKIKKRKSIF